jgi:hypothetical protein
VTAVEERPYPRLDNLPSSVLRELAAIAEQREQKQRSAPWQQLAPEAFDEALHMITDGQRPALGWWRHHTPPRPAYNGPATPDLPDGWRTRQWQPWELVAAAVDMADSGEPVGCGRHVLAHLAAAHRLDARALADAYIALGVTP